MSRGPAARKELAHCRQAIDLGGRAGFDNSPSGLESSSAQVLTTQSLSSPAETTSGSPRTAGGSRPAPATDRNRRLRPEAIDTPRRVLPTSSPPESAAPLR